MSSALSKYRPLLLDYRVQLFWALVLPVGLFALPTVYAEEPWPAIALYAAGVCMLAFGAALLSEWRRLLVLRCNAREAATYDGAYVFFLRSFSAIEGFQEDSHVTGTDGVVTLHEHSSVGEFDAAVRLAGLRLVALGGELVLPCRHGLLWLEGDDADWQANATRLAEGARAILLAPETTDGLVTEIRLLRDHGLLDRTIVKMLPLPQDSWNTSYPDRHARVDAWQRAQAGLAVEDIALPDYDARGAIFRLDADGKAADLVWLSGERGLQPTFRLYGSAWQLGRQREKIAKELDRLVGRCQGTSVPFDKIYRSLEVRHAVAEPVWLLRPPGSGSFLTVMWTLSTIHGVLFNAIAVHLALFFGLAIGPWLCLSAMPWLRQKIRRHSTRN